MVAYDLGQLLGVNQLDRAPFKLLGVLRVFEAERAQSDLAVVDAVAVEVNHVERLPRFGGLVQPLLKRLEGRRREDRELRQLAQALQSLDQRLRRDAVVNVRRVRVFGGRADEKDTSGTPGRPDLRRVAVRQAAAHAHGTRITEEEAATVVQKLPGERQQFGGGLVGCGLLLCLLLFVRAFGQLAFDEDREEPLVAAAGALPGVESLLRGLRRERGAV